MEFVIVLVILFGVVFVISGPLRRSRAASAAAGDDPRRAGGLGGAAAGAAGRERESRLAELDARREAKYREIRDAELDRDTGKLSDQDFEAVDSRLKADAMTILREIDELRGEGRPAGDGALGSAGAAGPRGTD